MFTLTFLDVVGCFTVIKFIYSLYDLMMLPSKSSRPNNRNHAGRVYIYRRNQDDFLEPGEGMATSCWMWQGCNTFVQASTPAPLFFAGAHVMKRLRSCQRWRNGGTFPPMLHCCAVFVLSLSYLMGTIARIGGHELLVCMRAAVCADLYGSQPASLTLKCSCQQ